MQARNLSCRDINGFDVPSSFVLRRGPKVVSGEKGFSRLVLNGPVTVKRLVNGVDLGVLQDSLLTQGTQVGTIADKIPISITLSGCIFYAFLQ